jgi:hypothetical protein
MRRRLTWIAHNVIMTPFIPIRLILLILVRMGELAESIGLRMPGWRRYDGWSGW